MNFLFSCKSENGENIPMSRLTHINDDGKKLHRTIISVKPYIDKIGKQKFEEIHYNVGLVSAFEYIKRTGQRVNETDKNELKKESVAIFEMELSNGTKSILESKRNPLDQNQTIQYLIGDIIKDFSIQQESQEFYPNGHHFENSQSKKNRIKLFLFFKGVDLKKKMRFVYHDRLFGAGLLNFGINKEMN